MGDSSEQKPWWNAWLVAAKSKGSEVLEFVKKDLEELGAAVKTEATNVASSLKLDEATSTATSLQRQLSSLLTSVTTSLTPGETIDDSDTEALLVTSGNDTLVLTKRQKALYELQNDEQTFLQPPEESPRMATQYKCWLSIQLDSELQRQMRAKLERNERLKGMYERLVPHRVSHQDFFQRYAFREALLDDELAQKQTAVEWDQEDFATDIHLTEQQQIQLLQQYEKETQTSSNTCSSSNTSSEDGDWEKINNDIA